MACLLVLLQPEPLFPWKATAFTGDTHSKSGLVQSLWGLLVCARHCLSPLSLAGMGFDLKCDFIPPTVLLGFSFPLGVGCLFLVGTNLLLLMIVPQQVVILEFSQEMMSSHPSAPPS